MEKYRDCKLIEEVLHDVENLGQTFGRAQQALFKNPMDDVGQACLTASTIAIKNIGMVLRLHRSLSNMRGEP